MSDVEITCTNCGGNDFYNESGFYYCNECQIQSQDVREQDSDSDNQSYDNTANTSSKKIQSQTSKSDKNAKQFTSWEIYNYILLGLCEELIQLGAQRSLKTVVRILWLSYLEKLKVFNRKCDTLPKLQAVNSAKDAEIIYGRPAKRKRRLSRNSSDSDSTTDLSNLTTSQIKAEVHSMEGVDGLKHMENVQLQDIPLLDETLETLQSSSESSTKSKKQPIPIKYNIYASRALKRKQSQYHLDKHRKDFDNNLKCHRYSYNYFNKVNPAYNTSMHVLSPNKLYIILYLGLIIIDDKIQLSDLFRFINEKNLSLKNIKHFFPEEYLEKEQNLGRVFKYEPFSNEKFRFNSAKMAKFLKIEAYLTKTTKSLAELCRRYCTELCLPTEVYECCRNLIFRTKMKMSKPPQRCIIPNYEGRVLSVIVFVLKLLYGLDNKTEVELSKYADLLNQCKSVHPKMFDIVNWMKFIEYRNLVLNEYHFPTNFSNNKTVIKNTKLFLDFLKSNKQSEDPLPKSKNNFYSLLKKLESYESNSLKFKPNLTPFSSYLKVLRKQGLLSNYLSIIQQDFTNDSLVYILEPMKFLDLVRKDRDLEIVHGGANNNWKIEELLAPFVENKRERKENRKLVTVKLSSKPKRTKSEVPVEKNRNTSFFQRNFNRENMAAFVRNRHHIEKICENTIYDFEGIQRDLKNISGCYFKHYNPFERYWMTSQIRIQGLWENKSDEFMSKYPSNLRGIFKECLRICEQTELIFIEEFIIVEFFITYGTNLGVRFKTSKTDNKKINDFVKEISTFW